MKHTLFSNNTIAYIAKKKKITKNPPEKKAILLKSYLINEHLLCESWSAGSY